MLVTVKYAFLLRSFIKIFLNQCELQLNRNVKECNTHWEVGQRVCTRQLRCLNAQHYNHTRTRLSLYVYLTQPCLDRAVLRNIIVNIYRCKYKKI